MMRQPSLVLSEYGRSPSRLDLSFGSLVKRGAVVQNETRVNSIACEKHTGINLEKGFNSDVIFKGLNFHVQTEDWGMDNPYLVSRVYQNGAVIISVKTPYSEVLGPGPVSRFRVDGQAIRLALREQHQKILDLLLSGQLF